MLTSEKLVMLQEIVEQSGLCYHEYTGHPAECIKCGGGGKFPDDNASPFSVDDLLHVALRFKWFEGYEFHVDKCMVIIDSDVSVHQETGASPAEAFLACLHTAMKAKEVTLQ